MELYEQYEKILEEHFHISYLKPYQELIVSRILEDKKAGNKLNMLACLPTGAGKSLCFMLPAALSDDYMMFIYPLRSLMNDQKNRFQRAGINAEILKGGMDRSDRLSSILRLKTHESHVLITNIEMLLLMIEYHSLDFLRNNKLTMVFDEAHTIISWGNTFRSAYNDTAEAISYLQPDAVLAFTATIDTAIYDGLVKKIFNGHKPYFVHASCDRQNIFYSSLLSLSKKLDIVRILRSESLRPALVFTRSRADAEEYAEYISLFYDCRYYHARLEPNEKAERETWFHNSQNGVMTATIAFGMGVDKPNIRTVIHTYLPDSATAFLQEAGRGGRDGRISYSIVLRYINEDTLLKDIFASGKCIRTALLIAMEEEPESEHCLACSSCVSNPFHRYGDRKLLYMIKRHPFKDSSSIISLLRNKKEFTGLAHKDISNAYHQLLLQWLIKEKRKKYRLTNKGRKEFKSM